MKDKQTININVPVLARVEGEGALELKIENHQISHLALRIYEPPRYFEKFLEGRNYYDVPDIVARICGICPVAYQMSASHAIESIFNLQISPWIRTMRRLFYCGEWIQSHSLHIHLLAAPDFLGFNSVIEMSKDFPTEVQRGLKLQTLGNDLVSLIAGRSVHPVGVKIGGFSHAPSEITMKQMLERVTSAKQDAIALIHWIDNLKLVDDEQDFISVALRHSNEYPFNQGRIVSDNGLDISIDEFHKHFREHQVDHSTALHCLLDDRPYLVGPLARLNLNANRLPKELQELMQELNTQFPSKNMFHSMIARALEIYYCLLEAEQIIKNYNITEQPGIKPDIKAGTGYGCTEAPRGILWHRYDIDDKGCVTKAVIIPPTSQNQARIEEDLRNSLNHIGLDQDKQVLQLHAEKVIRNYDPCISCATHFLDLTLIRDGKTEQQLHNIKIDQEINFRQLDLNKTAIIAVGSPVSGDDTAWKLIEELKHNEFFSQLIKQGLSLIKLDRPGINIKNTLIKFENVLIIDSLKHKPKDSNFIVMNTEQIHSLSQPLSSHGVGLIESLELLQALDIKHNRLAIIGVYRIEESTVTGIMELF